jgi:hypothetical protein
MSQYLIAKIRKNIGRKKKSPEKREFSGDIYFVSRER